MSEVVIRGLSIRRGTTEVIRALDLVVSSGSWCVVVGPNGAGKSSLLESVAGNLAYRGELRIDGIDVGAMKPRDRARLLAVVPQRPELPGAMTVIDYVLLGRTAHLSPFGREGGRDRRIVCEVLSRLELEVFAQRPVDQLSGGEMQRALIARALAQQPRVLVLDEPTSALDLRHQQQVMELIDSLRKADGLTVISALHDLTLAAQFGDSVALLFQGTLVATGDPATVLTQRLVHETYGADVVVRQDPEFGFAVIPRRSPQHPGRLG